jgi:hypothetical protein
MNQVDIEISLFGGQRLGQRRITKLAKLRRQAKAGKSPRQPCSDHHQLEVRRTIGAP